jgi:hypothetical protein
MTGRQIGAERGGGTVSPNTINSTSPIDFELSEEQRY